MRWNSLRLSGYQAYDPKTFISHGVENIDVLVDAFAVQSATNENSLSDERPAVVPFATMASD
jgi:hypothetical protein